MKRLGTAGCFVTLVLVAALLQPGAASGDFAVPSSNLVFQLEKQNRSHPWLRVTAGSERLTLKARRIERLGLIGLTAPDGVILPADPLAWSEIGRIDEVVTRAGRGRLLGVLALGLAGAGLGNALGAPYGDGGNYALLGFSAAGSVGGWLGARYGERFKHERNWYVADTAARTAPDTPIASTTPTSELTTPAPGLAAPGSEHVAPTAQPATPTPGLATSPEVTRVLNRIDRDRVFRMRGDFGQFQGFADVAGPDGLEGLRLDPNARREWASHAPPARVPWESIDEIHMRGGAGMKGALAGAASFGIFGALLGAAAVNVLGSGGDGDTAAGALAGAGICAPFGIVLGSGLGALARHWVVVYRRP